ncbi:MAG: hypothetical protein ACREFY_03350 [Acetobacteraceae bacterium]
MPHRCRPSLLLATILYDVAQSGREELDQSVPSLLTGHAANKTELPRALERPEIPLHTNGSRRDIRAFVTKRKVSGGIHSDAGRDWRNAFPGLMHTCTKLGFAFWDYLGDLLVVPDHPNVLSLPRPHRSPRQSSLTRMPGVLPRLGFHLESRFGTDL